MLACVVCACAWHLAATLTTNSWSWLLSLPLLASDAFGVVFAGALLVVGVRNAAANRTTNEAEHGWRYYYLTSVDGARRRNPFDRGHWAANCAAFWRGNRDTGDDVCAADAMRVRALEPHEVQRAHARVERRLVRSGALHADNAHSFPGMLRAACAALATCGSHDDDDDDDDVDDGIGSVRDQWHLPRVAAACDATPGALTEARIDGGGDDDDDDDDDEDDLEFESECDADNVRGLLGGGVRTLNRHETIVDANALALSASFVVRRSSNV